MNDRWLMIPEGGLTVGGKSYAAGSYTAVDEYEYAALKAAGASEHPDTYAMSDLDKAMGVDMDKDDDGDVDSDDAGHMTRAEAVEHSRRMTSGNPPQVIFIQDEASNRSRAEHGKLAALAAAQAAVAKGKADAAVVAAEDAATKARRDMHYVDPLNNYPQRT